jgi:serine/threonine protein kinase
LITRDGQACLADFGITVAIEGLVLDWCKLDTLRYTAPERFPGDFPRDITEFPGIDVPSKKGDVYSIAMTCFNVRSSAVNHPTT